MRLGIDLGGTKIEIIVLATDGSELLRRRMQTPRHNYQATLRVIAELVDEAEREVGERCTVGIGTPGAISPTTGLLKNSNSIWLNGKPFKVDVENVLERSVRMANDANCFALSEATDGAAKLAEVVFGVIVGTGTGAGIAINGQVLKGPNAIAGEWGHNPLPWPRKEELPGPQCYCGKRGCIETYLSAPGMIAHHYQITGQRLMTEEILVASELGDERAEITLKCYEDRMARSLSQVINILDPNVIVLGGGMSNIKRLYQNVPSLWTQYVLSEQVETRLVAPCYGDSSGVRGAAWLW